MVKTLVSPIIKGKNHGFRWKFSQQKPIHWWTALLAVRPEEILGVETPEDFSADPLGIETRLFRALWAQ
jgi:hypothetical protein